MQPFQIDSADQGHFGCWSVPGHGAKELTSAFWVLYHPKVRLILEAPQEIDPSENQYINLVAIQKSRSSSEQQTSALWKFNWLDFTEADKIAISQAKINSYFLSETKKELASILGKVFECNYWPLGTDVKWLAESNWQASGAWPKASDQAK